MKKFITLFMIFVILLSTKNLLANVGAAYCDIPNKQRVVFSPDGKWFTAYTYKTGKGKWESSKLYPISTFLKAGTPFSRIGAAYCDTENNQRVIFNGRGNKFVVYKEKNNKWYYGKVYPVSKFLEIGIPFKNVGAAYCDLENDQRVIFNGKGNKFVVYQEKNRKWKMGKVYSTSLFLNIGSVFNKISAAYCDLGNNQRVIFNGKGTHFSAYYPDKEKKWKATKAYSVNLFLK